MSAPASFVAFRCAVCFRLKGETNHWRLILLTEWEGVKKFNASEWDDDDALMPAIVPSCGDRCSLILFERWLSTGSLKTPQPNKPGVSPEKES